MDRATTNGGFPLPLAGEPVRVLTSHHQICEGHTRLRLPRAVPPRAVRRVVCDRCAEAYEPAQVDEVSEPAPRIARPSVPRLSLPTPSPSWRWLGLPVAGAAVLLVLNAVQGGDDAPSEPANPLSPVAAAPDQPGKGEKPAKVPGDAQLISESTFQLALPAGWERSAPSGGATFAAVAPDGDADAMLWIERDPKLSFAAFETRSLAQLKSIAGSADTVQRNPGPTPATTTSVIAPTDAPPGAPNYEVLISGGPGDRWYYLATTTLVDAGSDATAGVELIQRSFLPQGGGA